MRGLGPHILPSTNCGEDATSSCVAIRGEGWAKPTQAKRVPASVRRRSRSRVGTAHVLGTMWAQNTSLIETANACDVTRCGVAMEALPEKTEFAAPVIVLNRFERTTPRRLTICAGCRVSQKVAA